MTNDDTLYNLAKILWELIPPSNYPMGLSTYRYMWQYKATAKDYLSLLKTINDLDYSVRNILYQNIDGYQTGTTNVARAIALVISEWYKREASSLDGDRAMDIFTNEKMPSPEKIWKAAGFDDELLHKAKKASLRQTAMCVMGGFPLKYVIDADNRFEALINKLSEEEDEDDMGTWDMLFDANNSVFSGSLNNGSCKAFVDSLWNYLESDEYSYLPFSFEDLEDNTFKQFCRLIKNGYDKKIREDYFKETHLIYTSDEDYELQAQIFVQIGFKKDNHILFSSQLEKLNTGINITTENKLIFYLKAYYANGTSKCSAPCCYNKIGNHRNDFVSTNTYPLSLEYDLFNIVKVDLIIHSYSGIETCMKSFFVGDYMELFSTDIAYCWSSRKKTAINKAIIFNYGKFQDFGNLTTIEKRSFDLNSYKPTWSWILQNNYLNIKDVDGNSYEFKYINTPQIQASFSHSDIDRSIRTIDGMIEYFSESNCGRIQLLFGERKTLNLSILLINSEGRIRKSNDFILEYKEEGKYRFSEWTEHSSPNQGFLSIRVSTNSVDRIPFTTDVYYIPSANPVIRELDNNKIVFNDIDQVSAYDESKKTYCPLSNNFYFDAPPSDISNMPSIRDTISFRIGNNTNYVILEVYRAFFLQELIRNGKPFKSFFSNSRRQIPILYQKDMSVRTINEEGCKITFIENTNQIKTKDYFSLPWTLCNLIPINRSVDVYIYKSLSINGSCLNAPVSPRHFEQYRFFYWTGYRRDVPKLLKSNYHDNILSIDCAECKSDRGVIFQSQKDCTPNNYFRPYYVRGSIISDMIPPHFNLVYSNDDIFYAYKLFCEHKTYAAVFSPLYKLRSDRMNQKDLLSFILCESGYNLNKESICLLTRLANEVGFEWILIPRRNIQAIVRQSHEKREQCISSLRRLFADSPIVKENHGKYRDEKFYFKRIFVENNDYFDDDIRFDNLFKPTRYKKRIEARIFVEFIKGTGRYDYSAVCNFKRKTSDYDEYINLFRDIFYQYVINN